MVEILKNCIPVIVAITAAILTYMFSISSERRKQKQNNRTQAYLDFLKGNSLVWQSTQALSSGFDGYKEMEIEGLTLITDAKQRILIYGSDNVVKMLAGYYSDMRFLYFTEENALEYARLVLLMRKESQLDTKVSFDEMTVMIYTWLTVGK